jgi:hypothetical protein
MVVVEHDFAAWTSANAVVDFCTRHVSDLQLLAAPLPLQSEGRSSHTFIKYKQRQKTQVQVSMVKGIEQNLGCGYDNSNRVEKNGPDIRPPSIDIGVPGQCHHGHGRYLQLEHIVLLMTQRNCWRDEPDDLMRAASVQLSRSLCNCIQTADSPLMHRRFPAPS